MRGARGAGEDHREGQVRVRGMSVSSTFIGQGVPFGLIKPYDLWVRGMTRTFENVFVVNVFVPRIGATCKVRARALGLAGQDWDHVKVRDRLRVRAHECIVKWLRLVPGILD